MEREASVKLTLDDGQFIVNIRKAGDAVEDVAKKGEKSAGAWSAGLNGAKDTLGAIGGKIKEVIGLAAGLGGAFALGDAIHQGLSMREQFRDIEFQINKTGRAAVEWKDLLEKARAAADHTGQSTEAMGGVMENLFATTGDADFAVGALEAIGHAASAAGKDVGQVGNVAQVLQRKFGAATEDIGDMLAVVLEKTDAGGLSFEQMSGQFAELAGEASAAGFKGKDGLASLLGMLESLDSRVGEKSVPAMKQLFQIFRDGSAQLKGIEKATGIKFDVDTTALEKMRKVMATDRGRKTLQEKLGGEARVVYDELAKPFEEAFESAKQQGQSTKEATAAGLERFDAAIAQMGKSTLDYARLVDESKAGQKEDPMARLRKAQEKFIAAISNDKVFDAIDDLAKHLPALAEVVAKFVSFAAEHPLLAGAGAAGVMAGGGFAKGAMDAAISGAIEKAFSGAAVKDGAANAGSLFAKNAFATAGVLGAGALITAAIVEGITAVEVAKWKDKEEEANAAVIKKGNDLEAIAKEVSGMTEEEAFKQYGEQGVRFKRGIMTDEERRTFEERDIAKRSYGMGAIEENRERERRGAAMAAEYGLDEKLGLGAYADPLADPNAKLITLGKPLDTSWMKPGATPAAAPTPSQTGPAAVKIEDQGTFAQSLARELARTELKVQIAGSFDGSRGPLKPPPPRPH